MQRIERVTILGGGPGGIAAAAALTKRGFSVSLFDLPEFHATLNPLIVYKGVEIEGELGEEFISIPLITLDIEEAMQDTQLVMIIVAGYGQKAMIKACLPHLKEGIVILLMPGSAGSLIVAPIIKAAGFSLDEVLLGETDRLPQASRMITETRVRIKLFGSLRSAAFPGRNTNRMVEMCRQVVNLKSKKNILDPALNNPNFLIHPAPMLLNYAAVERADGYLSIMNEGMTAGVLRLLDAVDAEKMALQCKLGMEVVSIDDLYREAGSGPHIYRQKGEPFGIRDRIWPRYTKEDVPYGTVLYSCLGDLIDIPTPVCDGINTCLSIVEANDYWSEGRTAEKLGISGQSIDELLAYLETGEKL